MKDVRLPSDNVAMPPDGLIEGFVELKPMNDNGLGNVLHQIRHTQGGKPLGIECEGVFNTQTIVKRVTSMYNRNAKLTLSSPVSGQSRNRRNSPKNRTQKRTPLTHQGRP
jgi:hypothetical protein